MLEYQNISSKWSKKPKNQSDFHFFGQNAKNLIKIPPKWSKNWQNTKIFAKNDQKTPKFEF